MNTMFLDIYAKVSILIALADGILAIKSILKNKTTGRYLSFACAGAVAFICMKEYDDIIQCNQKSYNRRMLWAC